MYQTQCEDGGPLVWRLSDHGPASVLR